MLTHVREPLKLEEEHDSEFCFEETPVVQSEYAYRFVDAPNYYDTTFDGSGCPEDGDESMIVACRPVHTFVIADAGLPLRDGRQEGWDERTTRGEFWRRT